MRVLFFFFLNIFHAIQRRNINDDFQGLITIRIQYFLKIIFSIFIFNLSFPKERNISRKIKSSNLSNPFSRRSFFMGTSKSRFHARSFFPPIVLRDRSVLFFFLRFNQPHSCSEDNHGSIPNERRINPINKQV